VDANWHYTGDANFTRLKAALDLSIRPFERRFHTYIRPSCQGPVVRRCFLEDRRVWRLRKRIRTVDSDASSTGLKAPSDLSIQRFLRSFNTYRRPFWQVPVVRRCLLENRRVGGLLIRIGDAYFTQLNAPLNLSIQRFYQSFYTYRRPFWPVPVARRCILEDRHVWRLWQFGSRCEFHSNESSVRPMSKGLSAKLLYI
jgi:hypothetical protein